MRYVTISVTVVNGNVTVASAAKKTVAIGIAAMTVFTAGCESFRAA